MQSILRIKQRRSISLASSGPFNDASEMLRLCLMRRMLCMTEQTPFVDFLNSFNLMTTITKR